MDKNILNPMVFWIKTSKNQGYLKIYPIFAGKNETLFRYISGRVEKQSQP